MFLNQQCVGPHSDEAKTALEYFNIHKLIYRVSYKSAQGVSYITLEENTEKYLHISQIYAIQ